MSKCGAAGRWVVDPTGGRRYVAEGVLGLAQRALDKQNRTAELPPLEAGRWAWEPTAPTCHHRPLVRMTRASLCSSLARLGVGRLMVVGDSISIMAAVSLWNLVDGPTPLGVVAARPGPQQFVTPGCQRTLPCGESGGGPIELRVVRNDRLWPQGGRSARPWLDEYASGRTPTVLVLSSGAHYGTEQAFAADFNLTTAALRELPQQPLSGGRGGAWRDLGRDLLVLRTHLGGHPGCAAARGPLLTPDPAMLNATLYGWGLAPRFNALMRDAVRRGRQQQQQHQHQHQHQHQQQHQQQHVQQQQHHGNGTQHWHLLDVYPMTVLRPDGHLRPPGDCLHYHLPSVVDWWWHLLATLLADAANHRKPSSAPRRQAHASSAAT